MAVNSCYQSASDVRKNWSMTIDSVVHDRPAFINRTHDYFAMLDSRLLMSILKDYKYHVVMEKEDDGSMTGYVDELQLVENAPDKESCITAVISAMKDYATDYYAEFAYWSKAPNRTDHVPYVLKLLISDDEMIRGDMVCRNGKS